MPILLCPRRSFAIFGWMPGRSFRRDRNRAACPFRARDRGLIDLLRRPNTVRPCLRAAGRDGLGAALIGPSSSHRIMAVKASQKTVEESMDSAVTPTPPKFPQDFTVAHFLDRIGQNPTEVDGEDAKVGGLLRKAAHQPDVAALQPDLARPGLDPMDSSVGAMGPSSLGGRASRGLARFLIIFSIGIGATLVWQSYGDAARAMLANSSPQLGWLAPQTAPLAQTTPSMVMPPAAGWAIYAAGFAIWLFGYLSTSHAAALDWDVAAPAWISSFVPNLEEEFGLALMFASMISIYWRAGRK